MRNGLPAILVLSLSALLSACATTRAPFTPTPPMPNTGGVYFYRPSEMTGMLIKPTLSAGGAKLGTLANHTCAVAFLPPGEVQVRSQWPGIPGSSRDDSVTIAVVAGQNTYLRVRYHTNEDRRAAPGVVNALQFENRVGLEKVSEDEATPQMAGMGACPAYATAPAP